MRYEFYKLFIELGDYFWGSVLKVRPFFVLLLTGINYVLFPEDSYVPATIGVCSALILDMICKYYALSRLNGGFFKALKDGIIRSDRFWAGTKKKLIDVLVVMILCGLSYRVAPVGAIAVLLSNVAYSIMFLREAQSCIENLIDAGHDNVRWLLVLVKRKQEEILKDEKKEEKKDGN